MNTTPRTPRGGALAAQISQLSHNKMMSATNTKPTSAQLNQLMSENASLKSRLNSTVEDLREAREIYERQHSKWRMQYERMKEELSRRAMQASQYESLQRQHQQSMFVRSPSRGRSQSPRARLASSNLYALDKERQGDGDNPALQWVIAMPPWQTGNHPTTNGVVGGGPNTPTINVNGVSAQDEPFFADTVTGVSKLGRKLVDADVQTSKRTSPARMMDSDAIKVMLNANGDSGATADGTASPNALRTRDNEVSGGAVSPSSAPSPIDETAHASELRLLNSELLKLQAENSTLKGAVEMLKRDVATDASGQIVRRYEEMALQQIRSLGRALDAANNNLAAREREIVGLRETLVNSGGGRNRGDGGSFKGTVVSGGGGGGGKGRSPSNATSNSIRPSTAGAMQQMLLKQAREKAGRGTRGYSGSIIGNYAARGNPMSGGMAAPVMVSVGVLTDGPWVEPPPNGPFLAHDDKGRQEAIVDAAEPQALAALQHTLEVTKIQLRQSLEELAMAKATSSLGTTLTTVRKRTSDVGCQVSEQSDIERLFLVFREEYSAPNIEKLLVDKQNKAQGTLLALTEAAAYAPNDATKVTLQSTRAELLAAHEHIEELEFALELERREKQRALDYATGGSGSRAGSVGGVDADGNLITTPGEAARQAAHEIAFLCDTLAATKMENEMLHEKLQASERERLSAIQSLSTLRKKSNDIVRGCQSMAEESRHDAEAAMISLLGQVHQKASEASQLRGLLGQAKRSNEELQGRLEEMEKELISNKTKLFNLRDSTAKLREDYNLVTVQLRQVKQMGGGGGGSPCAAGSLAAAGSPMSGSSSPFRAMMINSKGNESISATGKDKRNALSPTQARIVAQQQQRHSQQHSSEAGGLDSPRDSIGAGTPRGGGGGGEGSAFQQRHHQHEVSALELLAGEHGTAEHDAEESGSPSSQQAMPQSPHSQKRASSPAGTNFSNATTSGSTTNGQPQSAMSRRRAYSEYTRSNRVGLGGVGGGGGALVTVDHAQLISENDCRLLLESLMPYAPGALTPAQIVDGVMASAELLNDRITELEAELKAKSSSLTSAKKDVAVLQQRIRKLETDKETALQKNNRPSSMKDRKELFTANQNQQMLREELRIVTQQLAETRARLEESEIEIEEGKSLMLRLIKE